MLEKREKIEKEKWQKLRIIYKFDRDESHKVVASLLLTEYSLNIIKFFITEFIFVFQTFNTLDREESHKVV